MITNIQKEFPLLQPGNIKLALIKTLIDCYREETKTKNGVLSFEDILKYYLITFHSSNEVFRKLERYYIPRKDLRPVDAIKTGAFLAVKTYGFIKTKLKNGGFKLETIPAEIRIIKHMFKMKDEGYTTVDIFDTIKKKGYEYKSIGAVQYALTNPIYNGKFKYNGSLIKGDHKPIISDKLFDRVSASILGRREAHAEKSVQFDQFPLSSSVVLNNGNKLSGSSLRGESDEKYIYYRDTAQNIKLTFNIKVRTLHKLFTGFLKTVVPSQLAWVNDNTKTLYTFFKANSDRLELITASELLNTNGQLSQAKRANIKPHLISYMEKRTETFRHLSSIIQLLKSEKKFTRMLVDETNRFHHWSSEDSATKILIQQILFPSGVIFDQDSHQFVN